MATDAEDRAVVACNIAARVAARYARRVFWAEREELEQEAMVAAHACRATFDPEVGVPFAAYAWRACIYHLRKFVRRNSAPVTVAEERFIAGLHRAPVEELDDHEQTAPLADALLADADWQFRAHEQIEHVLTHVQGDQRAAALRVLLGDEQPANVARDLGVAPARVHRLTDRARVALGNNAALFNLLKERTHGM